MEALRSPELVTAEKLEGWDVTFTRLSRALSKGADSASTTDGPRPYPTTFYLYVCRRYFPSREQKFRFKNLDLNLDFKIINHLESFIFKRHFLIKEKLHLSESNS